MNALAELLRKDGDKILNQTAKFVLTGNILNEINRSFSLILEQKDAMTNSFQILSNTEERTETFSDVQFLYDFFQNSPSLKVTAGHGLQETVSLEYFKSLRYLELVAISIKELNHLEHIRDGLETFVCMKTINEIKDILEKCGGDFSDGFIWRELKSMYLAHNFISVIDDSFQFAPFLHTLDLSFNQLENIDDLSSLSNLKHLNVGYNKLKRAPCFSGIICNKLQVLNLKYNFIDDIAGLSNLVNLRDLNLSCNHIVMHEILVPLANILSLQSLKLTGNPISFHPHHRIRSCQHLHNNTACTSFSLDDKVLSKKEKEVVGSIHPKIIQKRNTYMSQCSSSSSVLVEKPRRVRQATISTQDEAVEEIIQSVNSISSLVTSQEYLEKKKNVEQLRERLGEKWLLGDNLGAQGTNTPKRSPQYSSTPYQVDFLIHAKDIIETKENVQEIKNKLVEESSTAPESPSINTEVDPYADGNVSDDSDSLINIGKCDDDLYLVTPVGDAEPIFLVVTENFLAERDVTTDAKEHCKWDTERLISCKLINEEVHLEFDTLNTNRKQRQYLLEDVEERERLVKVLTEYIDKRPVVEIGTFYQCLKCNKEFKVEIDRYRRDFKEIECPVCQSNLVIEEQKNVDRN